jgi:hypothetical protein
MLMATPARGDIDHPIYAILALRHPKSIKGELRRAAPLQIVSAPCASSVLEKLFLKLIIF